jgi:hypothetical protein
MTPQELADKCSDAYSADRYNHGWLPSIKMLRRRGYDDHEIEAILRSKHTRWAGDSSKHPNGLITSSDLARYIDKYNPARWKQEIAQLVAETPIEEA